MRSEKSKKSIIINIFISFVIALVLWSILNFDNNNIISRSILNIPVKVTNEDTLKQKLLAINQNIQYYVNLEIRGTEESVNSINPEDVTAEIDLSKITSPGTQVLDIVVKGLNNTVILSETIPNSITVKVDYFTNKEFIPEIITQGIPGNNLEVISSFTEDTVTMEGDNTVLERVNTVSALFTVNGITEDTTKYVPVAAYDSEGNKLDGISFYPDMVLANVKIGETKEVPVNNPQIIGNIGDGYKVTMISVEPNKIMIAGQTEILQGINSLDVTPVNIPVNDNMHTFSAESQIELPEGVVALNQNLNVTVTVNIEQIQEKTITVSSLEPVGLADNLEVTRIYPGSVNLRLRGTASEFETVDLSTLSGKIDCTGLGVGSYDVNVSFDITNLTIVSIEPEKVNIEISNKN